MSSCKKRIVILIALVLMIGGIQFTSTQSLAAKVKLNKKSISLQVGKTYKLKVKGTKKKAKWSSNKKKVATVSKKGVVKGKKAGKAKITAKVGKKKYVCKVTVKKTSGKTSTKQPSTTTATPTPPVVKNPTSSNVTSVSTDVLAENVAINLTKTSDGVLIRATNNNNQWIDSLYVNYNLKTSEGVSSDTGNLGFPYLAPGASCERYIYLSSESAASVDIGKTVISKTVTAAASYRTYTNQKSNVSVTHEKNVDGDIVVTIKNNAQVEVDGYAIVYFYDGSGNIVSADESSIYMAANEQNSSTFYAPYEYDDDGDRFLTYSTYKVDYYVASSVYHN